MSKKCKTCGMSIDDFVSEALILRTGAYIRDFKVKLDTLARQRDEAVSLIKDFTNIEDGDFEGFAQIKYQGRQFLDDLKEVSNEKT